jgi:hypothetical protein
MATKSRRRRKRARVSLGYAVQTISELKHRVKAVCHSPYFDPPTMRFFKSKVHSVVRDRAANATCFVTSEQGPHSERRFSVSKFQNCKINRVGEFMQHGSLASAKAAARKACRV